MNYLPAGAEFWVHGRDVSYAKGLHVAFDLPSFSERLHLSIDSSLATSPQLRFTDDGVWTLLKLLGESVDDTDPSSQLYGDALITAIGIRLLGRKPLEAKTAVGLSSLQLKDALGYMDAQLPNRIELVTLAKLAGLSPAHYNRAFKASTGLPPYQWQLRARIERAKCMLIETQLSLEEIAAATGFADAAHFGRTFRKLANMTPGAWRSHHLD